MLKKLIIFTLLVLSPISAFAGFGNWFGGGGDQARYTDYGRSVELSEHRVETGKGWLASAWDGLKSWVSDNVFQPIGDFVDRVLFGRSVVSEHSLEGLGNLSGRIKLEKDGSIHSIGDKTVLELDADSMPLKAKDNEEYRLGKFEYEKESDSFFVKGEVRKADSNEKALANIIKDNADTAPENWQQTVRDDYSSTAQLPDRIVVLNQAASIDASADAARLSTQYRNMEREGMILYAIMQNDKVMRGTKSADSQNISWMIFDSKANTLNTAQSFYLSPSQRPLSPQEQTDLVSQLNNAQEIRKNGDRMAALKVEEKLVNKYGLNHVVNQKEQQSIQEHGRLIRNTPAEWETIIDYETVISGFEKKTVVLKAPNDGYPNFKEGDFFKSFIGASLTVDKPIVEDYVESMGRSGVETTNMPDGYVQIDNSLDNFAVNYMFSRLKPEKVAFVKPQVKYKRIKAKVKSYED